MGKKFVPVYTVDILKQVASTYNSRFEFAKAKCGAYRSACRMGVVDEVCAHMKKNVRKRKYSDQILLDKMAKYKSVKELHRQELNTYKLAWLRFGAKYINHFYDSGTVS